MSQHRWQVGFATMTAAILLLSGGCAGTDYVATGNSTVTFEVVTAGVPDGFQNQPYDCIQWGIGDLRLRPLDGACDTDSVNAGAPCLSTADCDPLPGETGTCVGSEANELIGDDGIQVLSLGIPGNILGGDCTANIDAGGVCEGLFEAGVQLRCFDESECGFCENFPPRIPCDTAQDCVEAGAGNKCDQIASCVNPANVRNLALIPPQSVVLSAGLYEISTLRVGDAMRYQNDPQPPLDPPGPFFRGCSGVSTVVDSFRDSLQFTVLPGQNKVVRFVVDIEELEDHTPDTSDCADFLANIVDILDCDTCEPAP